MKIGKNKESWRDVIGEENNKKPKATLNSLDRELRGFPQNRWGGYQTQRMRTYGGRFGAANKGRRITGSERAAIEAELKKKGVI